MPLIMGQHLNQPARRTYHIQVPDNPVQAVLPVIIVFHGGGQDAATIARRWGIDPPNPVPAAVRDYLLVFPESHPQMAKEWVHFKAGDSGFPTLDLDFVRDLLAEVTTRQYATGSVTTPTVTGDPELVYAAGFSNGGGMVWQLLYSALSASFRGFAMVGKALDPEKATHYRAELAVVGALPAAAPVFYLQGTADSGFRPTFTLQEQPVAGTLPFATLLEMRNRNVLLPGPAATTLVPGSTGPTEVVLQLFAGAEAYLQGTAINGGHNWPSPTTVGNPPVADHFDTTLTIIDFWQRFAALP
jgi:poly(3-hydroxybutyrate) depolymerase